MNLALFWVQPRDERAVRDAFDRAIAARTGLGAGQNSAEGHFFETLVHLHRAGEGAPYTGIKPEGAEVSPAVTAADQALAAGTVEPVRAMSRRMTRTLPSVCRLRQ